MPRTVTITLGDTGGISVQTSKATYTGKAAAKWILEMAQRVEAVLKAMDNIGTAQGARDSALLEIDAAMGGEPQP